MLHDRLFTTYSDTSEWKFVISITTSATATPPYRYGWMMFDVTDRKDTSPTVHTVLGADTTVNTTKMSPCRVIVSVRGLQLPNFIRIAASPVPRISRHFKTVDGRRAK